MLLRKSRSYAEVYNDLDGEVVNLFQVLRDRGDELQQLLLLTPFARNEFLEAWYPCDDPLEQARRTVVRSFMGFGSAAVTLARSGNCGSRGGLAKTGFRANSNRSGTTPAHDWANYPKVLPALIERLRGVVIENRDAVDCMRHHDSVDTLHYVDPPYVADTRDKGGDYRYEMTDEDHCLLAQALNELEGFVVLSGYMSPLYRELYEGWLCVERKAYADGARDRVECLWLNKMPPQGELSLGINDIAV